MTELYNYLKESDALDIHEHFLRIGQPKFADVLAQNLTTKEKDIIKEHIQQSNPDSQIKGDVSTELKDSGITMEINMEDSAAKVEKEAPNWLRDTYKESENDSKIETKPHTKLDEKEIESLMKIKLLKIITIMIVT